MGAFNDTFRLALDAAVANKADTITLETEAALVATAASFAFDGNGVLRLTTAGGVVKVVAAPTLLNLWIAANPTWQDDLATLAASTVTTKAATVKSKLEEAAGEL